MGSWDEYKLIEPLPCFKCNSEGKKKIGSMSQSKETKRGWLDSLQTDTWDDEGWLRNYYFFPGTSPGLPNPILLDTTCNSCHTSWEGELYSKKDERDGVNITNYLDLWSSKSVLQSVLLKDTSFYTMEFVNEKKIRVTPNIPAFIIQYNKETATYELNQKNYFELLTELKTTEVPVDKIRDTLESLTFEIKAKKSRGKYTNELARAVQAYIYNKELASSMETALEAAAVILYKNNPDAALELILKSGICTENQFMTNLDTDYSWFLVEDESKLTNIQKVQGLRGFIDGVNHYLKQIKKDETE